MTKKTEAQRRGASYLRVSTDSQTGEDRFGLDAQRAAVDAYAKANGIEIVHYFTDACTGATIDRPQLQAMLEHAQHADFEVVIVAKLDRIARDLMLSLWIEKELKKHDIEILSVAEPMRGNEPETILFRQIISCFAEFEKSRINQRMTAGRKIKAQTGGFAGGKVPLGYVLDGGKIVVDKNGAKTVRRVFQIREQHPTWTLAQVADRVNEGGFLTAQGKRFNPIQIKRVLDRRDFYRGEYRYSDVVARGQHAAILD